MLVLSMVGFTIVCSVEVVGWVVVLNWDHWRALATVAVNHLLVDTCQVAVRAIVAVSLRRVDVRVTHVLNAWNVLIVIECYGLTHGVVVHFTWVLYRVTKPHQRKVILRHISMVFIRVFTRIVLELLRRSARIGLLRFLVILRTWVTTPINCIVHNFIFFS